LCESGAPGRTLVLGLGNPLRGDDGVGAAVLDSLRSSDLVPPWVHVWSAEDGDVLGPMLAGPWRRIVVVDAADLGKAPGEWMRLGAGALAVLPGRASSHRVSLVDALGIAQALGQGPDRLTIFAVQPLSIDWGSGLSEPVAQALAGLVEAVLWEVGARAWPGGRTFCRMPQEQATHVRDERIALG
jgi:hydrogenase maturation protease